MKILNYTLKGRRLMLIAHVEPNAKNGEMNPVFDLYSADEPCGDSIAEGMTLGVLVDMLKQIRQDIDDLIFDYDGGVREPMLRDFAEAWSSKVQMIDEKGDPAWVYMGGGHAD